MNTITSEQNQDRQIHRLAAQRQLYAKAKVVLGSQLILAGPLTVVLAVLVNLYPDLKVYVSLWGLGLALCDLLWLTPWQKGLRRAAALLQECFDCDVLSLPWNGLKAGRRPDPELIQEQARKYERRAKNMPPLSDWYAPDVGRLPLHIGRVACQHSNCWWDSKLRRRYGACIAASLVLVFLSVLRLALRYQLTIEDFFLKVVVPLLPMFLLGIRQVKEQWQTAKRLDELKKHAESLWASAVDGEPESEITARSRDLQDEIFESRKRGPLVFDRFYKRLQPHYEEQMNRGLAELVAEAESKL